MSQSGTGLVHVGLELLREEVSLLEKYGKVLGNDTALDSSPRAHNLTQLANATRSILEWKNNDMLPWLTVFPCFPWMRETGLLTEYSLLFLNAYGDTFCN
jgi:hypothetical protein